MKPAGRITIGGGTPDVTVLFQVCHELLGGIDLDRPPYSFPCAARKNSPCSSVMIETTILAQDICTNSPVLTCALPYRWSCGLRTGYMHKLTSVNSGYQVTSDNSYLFSIHTVNNLVLNLWNDFSFSSRNGRLFGVGYSVKFRAISSWGGQRQRFLLTERRV